MRKPRGFYSLQRPKIRLSWNKHNVYNLARSVGRDRSTADRMTFFQMKWDAKARTRGYHGDHITEKKWKRMFSHRLMSAVDLPPEYLAANDGSEQAAGRGSGKSTNTVTAETFSKVPGLSAFSRPTHGSQMPRKNFGDPEGMLSQHHKNMTPYMQMAYAPLERRLDMAVFRALFASSIRQARQFVIHGAVMVNGKKMVHPSYLLNPGDMFQVDPEKVMYGTGREKSAKDKSLKTGIAQKTDKIVSRTNEQVSTIEKWFAPAGTEASADGDAQAKTEPDADTEASAAEVSEDSNAAFENLEDWQQWYITNQKLKAVLAGVRQIVQDDSPGPKKLTAKKKQALRVLMKTARRMLSLPEGASRQEMADELMLQLSTHETMRRQYIEIEEETKQHNDGTVGQRVEESQAEDQAQAEAATSAAEPTTTKPKKSKPQPKYHLSRHVEKATEGLDPSIKEKVKAAMGESRLSREEIRRLGKVIVAAEENPIDETKPYATPWEPKQFMSAFAFIPRYLEVNPKVCAAVYLRHPVARKGLAEVPTPFSYLTNQLAHNWYLQRGPRNRQ